MSPSQKCTHQKERWTREGINAQGWHGLCFLAAALGGKNNKDGDAQHRGAKKYSRRGNSRRYYSRSGGCKNRDACDPLPALPIPPPAGQRTMMDTQSSEGDLPEATTLWSPALPLSSTVVCESRTVFSCEGPTDNIANVLRSFSGGGFAPRYGGLLLSSRPEQENRASKDRVRRRSASQTMVSARTFYQRLEAAVPMERSISFVLLGEPEVRAHTMSNLEPASNGQWVSSRGGRTLSSSPHRNGYSGERRTGDNRLRA